MNRVLYLTFDGLSDPLGQSQILPYLVGLSRAGYDITIISLEKDTAYSQHASGLKRILEDADISLGTWYCLEEMLEFFSILKSARPNWKFLFVTQEPPATVLKAAKKHKVEKDVRVVSATPLEVPRYLQACDLAISFIKPCFSKIASSPTKLGEYLATGLPTIANSDIGDMAYFQENYAMGPVVPRLEPLHYRSAIDSLEDFLQKDKGEFRQLAQTCFDLKAGVLSYHQVYRTLLETK